MKAVHLRIALLASALGATQAFGGLTLNSGTSYDVTFTYEQLNKITFLSKPAAAPSSAHAGFYKLSVTDGTDSINQIVSFCIELSATISGTNQMTYWGPDDLAGQQSANLSVNQVAALDALFENFYVGPNVSDWTTAYGSGADQKYATALQLAVWEVTHETESNGWNLGRAAPSPTMRRP